MSINHNISNVNATVNSLANATGPVTIPMTNDYLFRALLQRSNKALKGLISALLHLPPEEIHSVSIENPIELGEAFQDKDFYLDTKVTLNDNTIINLEMQVINQHDWPERSLSYLCRTFDNLNKGQTYINVHPVIHIGFLDFTLFPEFPEFYATYKFMNVKNHAVYSDKLTLGVVNLNCIDIATEEDRRYLIDHWAALFKSTTWEEIKMLAENDEYIREASDTVYKLTQEEKIRLQCEAREDYYRRHRDMEIYQEQLETELAQLRQIMTQKDSALAEKDAEIAERDAEIARLKATLTKKP